jgi:hypothetical protein
MSGVNGTPPWAVKIPPNSHPLNGHARSPETPRGVGIFQSYVSTRFWPTLKSEGPRLTLRSKKKRLEIPFRNWSPSVEPELVSMLLDHV